MKYLFEKNIVPYFLHPNMASFSYSWFCVIVEINHGDLYEFANIVSRLVVISFKEIGY
jgi:hypothetical protein